MEYSKAGVSLRQPRKEIRHEKQIHVISRYRISYFFGILALFAQTPIVNIGPRHGNLRAAQQYLVQAYQKLESVQSANEDQLGGHAQKAKELLAQVDAELRLAANSSNQHGR